MLDIPEAVRKLNTIITRCDWQDPMSVSKKFIEEIVTNLTDQESYGTRTESSTALEGEDGT